MLAATRSPPWGKPASPDGHPGYPPCTPCYPLSPYPSLSWQLQPDQVEKDDKFHHTKHQLFLPTPQQHSLALLSIPLPPAFLRQRTNNLFSSLRLVASSQKPSSGSQAFFHCFSSFLDYLTMILLGQALGRGLRSLLELFLCSLHGPPLPPHTIRPHVCLCSSSVSSPSSSHFSLSDIILV